MTKNKNYFKKILEQQIEKNAQLGKGNSPYGGNILPILRIYENLTSFEEKMSFQEALTDLLKNSNEEKRRFAVTVCTGFIDFRKTI